jgi:glycosyltransferase involved in cell wall biosynthesis
MKLLIYTHDWAPSIGGTQTITMSLARGLASRVAGGPQQVDVTLVTNTPRGAMDDAGANYRIVRAPRLWQLASLLRESDLIHLAGPSLSPLILAWLLRKPVVVEHHGFQTICPNGQLFYKRTQSRCPGYFMTGNYAECIACNRGEGYVRSVSLWLLTFARRWLCKRVAANITPTDWLAAQLQLPRMTTIYHGVPDAPRDIGKSSQVDRVKFAFLGRLVSTKNVPVLLHAMAELQRHGNSCQLLIIGDGPERKSLEQLTTELAIGGAVSFLSYIPETDLERALAGVIAVVSPGASGEVFGLAAAENMRHGRIAIVPAASALEEVVGDSGLTFPEGDPLGLAGAMQRLLAEPELRERLSSSARERSEKLFQENAMVDAHIFLYNSIQK